MSIRKIFTLIAVALTVQANADNYQDMEPLKLEVPEMKSELVTLPEQSAPTLDMSAPSANHKMDFDFFKSKTNPGVKPYTFMDDMTFVGVPLFAAGWALKSEKAMFRVNAKAEQGGKSNTQLLTDFKTGIDDYTQFFGPAMVVGLKLGGYEGRSDWPRLLASAGMSYAIMAAFVNGIKYTAKEMRPDGSTANSWPSGHTATAFVGASLLHKEYGLTRSPWWSVAGYGVATATGVMRVLNNRHWISDVMSGAGLGILSTELGYAICDVLFKGKGLLRNDMELSTENPSFFSVSMGVGLGGKDLTFGDEYGTRTIKFRSATVVDAEGAYFFNKYIGVGGRLRVRAQSAKDFGDFADYVGIEGFDAWDGLRGEYEKIYTDEYYNPATTEDEYLHNILNYLDHIGFHLDSEERYMNDAPVTNCYGIVKSDHLTEFTASVGLYFNLPLGKRFSLGTKALIGRSITQELDVDGHAEGFVKNISYDIGLSNFDMQPSMNSVAKKDTYILNYPGNTGEKWSDDWEYLTIGAKSSTSFGTGLSLTYKYKSNFSWRLYADYDYTRKNFKVTYDPLHFMAKSVTPATYTLMQTIAELPDGLTFDAQQYETKKHMNYFTIGLSFLVNL